METISQIVSAIQRVMITKANQVARPSGLIQRKGLFNGSQFAQTLVFGWMANPNATLEELTQTAASLGAPISPQGLDQRFTPAAAEFLRQVLEAAVQEVISADPVAIPLLARFTGVYLLDSSIIPLPDELHALWRGLGGNSSTGTAASLKLQVRLNWTTGALEGPQLCAGRSQDRASRYQRAPLPAKSLRMADLGYFSLAVLAEVAQQDAYWLTRYRAKTVLWTPDRKRLNLLPFLDRLAAGQAELQVLLGNQQQLPARLLIQRVPQEVAEQRRRRMREQARIRQEPVSAESLKLAAWTLLLTNVPDELLSVREAMVLIRVRWQVELLFKLWKSHARVDEWRSRKPWRILCEIYAKLIGLLIQHWFMIGALWPHPGPSFFRAIRWIQKWALALAVSCQQETQLRSISHLIQKRLAAHCRITKRKKKPATFQLLLALTEPA